MADTQALNATFFAFKRRERGGVLTLMTITYWVLTIVVFGAFVVLNTQGIADYATWYGSLIQSGMQSSDPAAMQSVMPPASVMALGPAYLLLLLVTYVLLAAYEAGCLRWMVRGETGGLFGLSLGADTWRVYFGYWVWLFLLIALYLVFILLAAGIGVAFAMSSGGVEGAAPATAIAMVIGMLLFFGGLIFFGVRFAPAAATSIARKRFAFFDAWTVSKGRFWALFGSFFLLLLMFFVLYLIVGGGLAFAMMSTAQIAVGGTEPQNPQEAFEAFANPQSLALVGGFFFVMVVASMLLYLAMFGVNARAAALALEQGKIKAEA